MSRSRQWDDINIEHDNGWRKMSGPVTLKDGQGRAVKLMLYRRQVAVNLEGKDMPLLGQGQLARCRVLYCAGKTRRDHRFVSPSFLADGRILLQQGISGLIGPGSLIFRQPRVLGGYGTGGSTGPYGEERVIHASDLRGVPESGGRLSGMGLPAAVQCSTVDTYRLFGTLDLQWF